MAIVDRVSSAVVVVDSAGESDAVSEGVGDERIMEFCEISLVVASVLVVPVVLLVFAFSGIQELV